MGQSSLKSSAAWLVAAALGFGLSAVPASSQEAWSGWKFCSHQLRLPDDQDRLQARTILADRILEQYPVAFPSDSYVGVPLDGTGSNHLADECASIRGTGTIELTVELDVDHPSIAAVLGYALPPLLELALLGQDSQAPSGWASLPVGSPYRELLVQPDPVGRRIDVTLNAIRLTEFMDEYDLLQPGDTDVVYRHTQIVWTLRRLERRPCSMRATVSGDVSGTHSGDVAFFNVFEKGVKEGAAAGTALDAGAQATVDGLLGFAEWVDGFLEDGDDDEKESATEESTGEDSKLSFGQALEQEWDLSGTDTFGLSLVAVHFDLPEPEPAKGDKLTGGAPAAGGLGQAMAFLGSTFSLAATGVTPPLNEAKAESETEGDSDPPATEAGIVGKQFTVALSTVSVLPGAMDANLGGVKFLWKAGQPGNPRLTFRYDAPGVIEGMLEGEVYSERPYGERRLKIKVWARFTALEGALACQ